MNSNLTYVSDRQCGGCGKTPAALGAGLDFRGTLQLLWLSDIDQVREECCQPCYIDRRDTTGMSPTQEEAEHNHPLLPAWGEWMAAWNVRAKAARAAKAKAEAAAKAKPKAQAQAVAVVQEQARAEAAAAQLLEERKAAFAMAIATNPRAFVGGKSRKPRRRWRRENICLLCRNPYYAWSSPTRRPTFCCGEHGAEYRALRARGIEHPHMTNAVRSPARAVTTLAEFEAMEQRAPQPRPEDTPLPWSRAAGERDPEEEQYYQDNPAARR